MSADNTKVASKLYQTPVLGIQDDKLARIFGKYYGGDLSKLVNWDTPSQAFSAAQKKFKEMTGKELSQQEFQSMIDMSKSEELNKDGILKLPMNILVDRLDPKTYKIQQEFNKWHIKQKLGAN